MPNRRSIIKRISLGILAATAGVGGYYTFQLRKSPDIESLDANKALIEELAETIIPETDTPGAKTAKCADTIIKLVKDCTDKSSQNRFIDGLSSLKDYTQSSFGKEYAALTTEEKHRILQHFEKQGQPQKGLLGKAERKLLGNSFFTTLKNYTVIAWCTSKAGATQGLAYDFIPGSFIADIPLANGQKSWATQ